MASSKMTIYILMMSGIMLLMYFGGLITTNGTAYLLNTLLGISNVVSSKLYTEIYIALALGFIGGVAAVMSYRADLVIFSFIAIVLLDLGMGFLQVFNILYSFSGIAQVLAILLFSPLMVLFLITVAEWWRGITS